MTVTAGAARSGPYDGPGSTFDYTFVIESGDELLVTKTDAYGTEEELTYNADYSVSIGDDGTGTFTLDTALVEGEQATATLNLDIEQATDFTNLGSFSAEAHEMALDRIVRMMKMVKEKLDRCLCVNVSSDEDATELSYEQFIKRPCLIDEQEVSNEATLDVGDTNGISLWTRYGMLKLELFEVVPATDGDVLYLQFGGDGGWWADANYFYAVSLIGASDHIYTGASLTSIPSWFDHPLYTQGNDATVEALHGKLLIALAQESGADASRTLWGNMAWATTSSSPYVSVLTGRYPTTKHVSAVRLFYGGGNIYGKARLWGMPKS